MPGQPQPPASPEAALLAAIAEFVRSEVAKGVAAALATRSATGELLTTAEAAVHARVTPATIRRWIAGGKLPERRAGREVRVTRADLEQLLARGTRRPADSGMSPEQLAARDFG